MRANKPAGVIPAPAGAAIVARQAVATVLRAAVTLRVDTTTACVARAHAAVGVARAAIVAHVLGTALAHCK